MEFNDYIALEQFSLSKKEKQKHFLDLLNDLNTFHLNHSDDYKRVSEVYFHNKVTCVYTVLHAQDPKPAVALSKLQHERLAVLKQLKPQTEDWYGIGKTSINAVHQVRWHLLEAELEQVTQPEEQLKISEAFAKEAETWEQKVAKSIKDGHKPGIDAVIAKVFWLDAQIALEKARARLGVPKGNK